MNFYRYELRTTISFEDTFSTHNLILEKYTLIKETEKGYWICYGSPIFFHGRGKWIPKESKKRFAYPTKEEALKSYIARTKRRINYLTSDLETARLGLSLAKNKLINI